MTRQDHSQGTVDWMQGVLGSEKDLLAQIVEMGLQALMEAERDVHVGAAPFERVGIRQTQRNGYQAADAGDARGDAGASGASDPRRTLLSVDAGAVPA